MVFLPQDLVKFWEQFAKLNMKTCKFQSIKIELSSQRTMI